MRRAADFRTAVVLLAMAAFPVAAQSPWSPAEVRVIASMRLSQLPPTPADPSNRFERDPRAIALGKELFF